MICNKMERYSSGNSCECMIKMIHSAQMKHSKHPHPPTKHTQAGFHVVVGVVGGGGGKLSPKTSSFPPQKKEKKEEKDRRERGREREREGGSVGV